MLFWVRGNIQDSFVVRHRSAFQFAIAAIYELYVFFESYINTFLGPKAFGLHWTFLNLVIIAAFLFELILQTKWVFALYASTSTLYALAYAQHFSVLLISLAVLNIAIQYFTSTHGAYLHKHGLLLNLDFAVFGFVALTLIAVAFPGKEDIWFWVRQIGALTVIYTSSSICTHLLERQNRELSEYHTEATLDSLTEVKNMGAFNTDLTKLYAAYRQTQATYRLIELDIDHFKHVNDTYGHLVGNDVLRAVAACLREIAVEHAPADVYRMGGEEFGIIMQTQNPHREDAKKLGHEINRRIEDLDFHAKGEIFHVTVSIGLEKVLSEDNNYLDIYSKADHYLYQSKHGGRNAVTIDGETYKSD